MRSEFQKWMIRSDDKKENVAYQYALSIEKISRHYFEKTGKKIDLYGTKDIDLAKTLSIEYGKGGKYSEFGDNGSGTIRNAIKAYVRFLEGTFIGKEIDSNTDSNIIEEDDANVIGDAQDQFSTRITYEGSSGICVEELAFLGIFGG